jgi:hypothetical protein
MLRSALFWDFTILRGVKSQKSVLRVHAFLLVVVIIIIIIIIIILLLII